MKFLSQKYRLGFSLKKRAFRGNDYGKMKKNGRKSCVNEKKVTILWQILEITYTINYIMGDTDKDLVYSESIKAGKRIYYFDVKQSRNGDRYIAITESKKINEGTMDNPRFVFEKHKLFLYKEDYEKFVDALMKTLDVAKGNAPAVTSVDSVADEAPVAPAAEETSAEASAAEETATDIAESPAEEPVEKKSFLDKVKDIF